MALVGEMKNLTIGNKTYHIPIPTKTSDLTNDSNFMSGMTILSYGTSTWNDFLTAYKANHVVYCRASSNANPASGSQTRMAFMAYVSDATNPTNVEFQYYRSVSSHTSSQQGDQVYVYKLTSANAWTVTVREASVKIKINTNNEGIKTTYSSGTVSIGHANSVTAQTTQAIYPIKIDAQGHISEYGNAVTIPTVDQTYDSTSANAQSGVAVASAIASLPEPMLFKGSLGTGGTITTLPSAAASNEGFVYKVITAGTYASQAAKVGDTFISDGSNWVLIPSGDEPSGTVTSVGVANATNGGLSVSGSPITSSGTITVGLDAAYGDTKNPYGNKTANYVLAGPISGSAAAPSFRALVEDDIPDLSNTYLTESSLDGYIKNIEGENWSNTIILDNGEGTASIHMSDRILNKTTTIYWSTGDSSSDSSAITLEAEKINLDANEILTSFNYTPTLANHFVNKGYVDTAIGNSLEIFLIEVSYDEDEENYVSNKTFSQIQAAIIANKTLLLHFVDEDRFYQCNAYSDDDISFYCLIGTTYYFIIIYNNNAIEIDYEFYNNDRLKWTSTVASNTYYPLVGTTASDSAGQGKTLNGIDFYQYYNTAGGYRRLDLGNSTSWKSSGGAYGTIRLYGTGSTYYGDLIPGTLGTTSGDGHISANRTWTLPDKTGTIALTSDVPDVTGKQDTLVSGTNIKTINNTSLLGNGNLNIEGVPHVDLTQAQYDALSSAEKNNGTIYFITDGEPGGSSSNSIADVRVNNTSVVSGTVADIPIFGTPTTTTPGTDGVVPAPPVKASPGDTKVLSNNGNWVSIVPLFNQPTSGPKTGTITLEVGGSISSIPVATTTNSGAMSFTDKLKLDGVASGAEVNVQADWNEANSSSDAYIQNKPTIPTATSDLTNDSGFIFEDANGDISITRNISAGGDIEAAGDVTDGAGNVLANLADSVQKHIISVRPSSDITRTGTGDSRVQSYNTISKTGSKLTNSSGVVIGSGVSMIKISYTLRFNTTDTNHTLNAQIYRNGTAVNALGLDTKQAQSGKGAITCAPLLMSVNQGDVFCLGWYGQTSDTLYAFGSMLTIEVVA